MPRVKILQDCYNNRQRLRAGAIVDWPLKKGETLPKYVEPLDEDSRPVKGKGKAAPDPELETADQEEVI